MPEGPEARTVADKLRKHLVLRSITSFYTGERANTVGFYNLRCPDRIVGVVSYGKKVIIKLESGNSIIVSLGMSGRLQYKEGNHSHIRFDLSEYEKKGRLKIRKEVGSVYFDDTRYMGGIDIIPSEGMEIYFKSIGPDLLEHAIEEKNWISSEKWISIYKQKRLGKKIICDVLMNQDLIAGMGWYIITEVLYYGGIHPERKVDTITEEEWERLRICAHKIIVVSYSYGGFTINSFISPDEEYGLYPAGIYGKKKDGMGNEIINKRLKNGRTGHWVEKIQH